MHVHVISIVYTTMANVTTQVLRKQKSHSCRVWCFKVCGWSQVSIFGKPPHFRATSSTRSDVHSSLRR